MSKNSAQQTINCFYGGLPHFLKKQSEYEANRKIGTRPSKSEYRKLVLTIKSKQNGYRISTKERE